MIIVEIAGYLGSDAEERFTATGKRVINLRVATKVRQGGKDETVWWRVSIWGDRFDKMLPYLKKGTSVIIIGDMGKPETYVGKDGISQISLTLNAEIIKFSPFGKGERSQEQSITQSENQAPFQQGGQYASHGVGVGAAMEPEGAFAGDDLPF